GEREEHRRPALASLAAANGNGASRAKKVVHLGTIVDDLDAPTWQRNKQRSEEAEPVTLEKTAAQFGQDDDAKFDVPTFLRRQMD
ncbi:MAG TPA: hypothetical protein VGA73_17470, partial [Candidatus Binatia bacterium]